MELTAEKVEWNMAALLNMELGKLRSETNRYFVQKDYRKAVDCLISMWMTAVHVMSPAEKTAVEKLDTVLRAQLVSYGLRTSWNSTEGKKGMEAELNIRKIFPKLNEKVMDALFVHGFLGAMKKDSSKMINVKYD